jgi:hypothetical protein
MLEKFEDPIHNIFVDCYCRSILFNFLCPVTCTIKSEKLTVDWHKFISTQSNFEQKCFHSLLAVAYYFIFPDKSTASKEMKLLL